MTIATVIDGFQTVNATITGVTWAPALADYPDSLRTAALPLALTFAAGNGAPTKMTSGWTYHLRQYVVRVYVKPTAQGQGYVEGYEDCVTLLQAFVQKYMDDITLGGVIQHMGIEPGGPTFEDTGIIPLTAGGDVTWWGFEIRAWTKEQIIS